MSVPACSFQYPLFALRYRSDGEYVTLDLHRTRPRRDGTGVPVFTTERQVAVYHKLLKMGGREHAAEVGAIDRPATFRRFLRWLTTTDSVLLIDPRITRGGQVRVSDTYPPADVLAELPEEDWNLTYPLFALRCRPGLYMTCDLGQVRPRGIGCGLPVFTTEEKVAAFLAGTDPPDGADTPGEIVKLERELAFGRWLQRFLVNGKEMIVLFDPVPDPNGCVCAEDRVPAAELVERFVRKAAWVWRFPVYAIRSLQGWYKCGRFRQADGTWVQTLEVYTDWDLADRAVLANPLPSTAVPVKDGPAFARFLSGLPAEVRRVAFDPPCRADTRPGKFFCIPREQLLADLECDRDF